MTWNELDLTTSAKGKPPLATFSPGSYIFLDPDGNFSQHIIYQGFTSQQGSDARVHELYSDTAGDWHHHDLSEAAGAPPATFLPFTGYGSGEAVGGKRVQHVNYLGSDGGVHELYWDEDGWHHRNLTSDIGAPTGLTTPKGYVFGSDQHVAYSGTDHHIHDLRWRAGDWTHSDLTDTYGGPLAQGSPTAYVCDFQNTQHVDYRGIDGHIHELAGVEVWQHTDLTMQAGAPLAADDPSGYVLNFQGTQHVDYFANDGHLHDLWWGLDEWHDTDLTLASVPVNSDAPPQLSGSTPTGYVFEHEETQYVNYTGANGHIYQLRSAHFGMWQTTDLSALTAGPPPPSISSPTGYIFPLNENAPHVAYNSGDHHIILLYWI